MPTVRCTSYTFAAADPGKENWHNKGRNSMSAALDLKKQCERDGMRCTTPREVVIEHEVPEHQAVSQR